MSTVVSFEMRVKYLYPDHKQTEGWEKGYMTYPSREKAFKMARKLVGGPHSHRNVRVLEDIEEENKDVS